MSVFKGQNQTWAPYCLVDGLFVVIFLVVAVVMTRLMVIMILRDTAHKTGLGAQCHKCDFFSPWGLGLNPRLLENMRHL